MKKFNIRRFYRGDTLYRKTDANGKWGIELTAVVHSLTFLKEDKLFVLFHRPWYNWLKNLYDIIFKIERQ
jgi:hypothetical protein